MRMKRFVSKYLTLAGMAKLCIFGFGLSLATLAGMLMAADLPNAPPFPVAAQPSRFAREADKAAAFQQVAKEFDVSKQTSQEPSCQQMLRDFQTMSGITFIEPTVKAATFDDPKLDRFRNQWTSSCSVPSFNIRYSQGLEGIDIADLDRLGEATYVSANIAVYELPLGANKEEKKSEIGFIFYGEHECARLFPNNCTSSLAYDYVTPEDCGIEAIWGTTDPYFYPSTRPTDAASALVDYKHEHYVVTCLRDNQNSFTRIILDAVQFDPGKIMPLVNGQIGPLYDDAGQRVGGNRCFFTSGF